MFDRYFVHRAVVVVVVLGCLVTARGQEELTTTKPLETEWISLEGQGMGTIRQKLRDALEKIRYATKQERDSQVQRLKSEAGTFNAEWEREALMLSHRKDVAGADLTLQESNQERIREEISFKASVLASLQKRVEDREKSQSRQEMRERQARVRFDQAYNSLRQYYIIYVESPVPADPRGKFSDKEFADFLRPAMKELAIEKGSTEYLSATHIWIDNSFHQLILTQRGGMVSELAAPSVFWDSTETRVGVLFAVSLQREPPTAQRAMRATKKEEVPAWISVTTAVVYDGNKDLLLDDALTQAGLVSLSSLESLVVWVKAFLIPDAQETWAKRCEDYGAQLQSIRLSVEDIKKELINLNAKVTELEQQIRVLTEEQEKANEAVLRARKSYSAAEEEWASHILNRRIRYLPMSMEETNRSFSGNESPEEVMPELLDEIHRSLRESSRQHYLSSVKSYINYKGASTYLESEEGMTTGAQVTQARIFYKYYDRSSREVNLGLAIDVVYQLPQHFLVIPSRTDIDEIRGTADIDSSAGVVEYHGLLYKVLDVGGFGESFDNTLKAVNGASKQTLPPGVAWRLPSREELARIRHVSRTDTEGESFTAFPELGVKTDRFYWTNEEAGTEWGVKQYWTFAFGETRIERKKPATAACYCIMVADASASR